MKAREWDQINLFNISQSRPNQTGSVRVEQKIGWAGSVIIAASGLEQWSTTTVVSRQHWTGSTNKINLWDKRLRSGPCRHDHRGWAIGLDTSQDHADICVSLRPLMDIHKDRFWYIQNPIRIKPNYIWSKIVSNQIQIRTFRIYNISENNRIGFGFGWSDMYLI